MMTPFNSSCYCIVNNACWLLLNACTGTRVKITYVRVRNLCRNIQQENEIYCVAISIKSFPEPLDVSFLIFLLNYRQPHLMYSVDQWHQWHWSLRCLLFRVVFYPSNRRLKDFLLYAV